MAGNYIDQLYYDYGEEFSFVDKMPTKELIDLYNYSFDEDPARDYVPMYGCFCFDELKRRYISDKIEDEYRLEVLLIIAG